jgi:hypothetical protein
MGRSRARLLVRCARRVRACDRGGVGLDAREQRSERPPLGDRKPSEESLVEPLLQGPEAREGVLSAAGDGVFVVVAR